MRKAFFYLFFLSSIVQINGQSLSDFSKVNLNEQSASLEEILERISHQTSVDFSFNTDIVNENQRIDFVVRNVPLEEAVKQLCEEFGLEYIFVEGQIVLIAAKKKLETFVIKGYISDKESGETLISSSLAIKGSNIGTYSNDFGFYSLVLKEGSHTLVCSYVGYEAFEFQLVLDGNKEQNIELKPLSIELPSVTVELSAIEVLNKPTLGEMNLKPSELNQLPEFGGESGLIKGIQNLPGIKGHSDGSSFFYARGGERDQNLLIIDDAPIYNPTHLFGFYSFVVPEFTKEIKIFKSDMPASSGDFLSSLISVRTKDGNLNKFGINVSLNPLVNRFSFEVPMFKKKSALFASYRRSSFEWLYKPNYPNSDLHFGDFNFKWNIKLGSNSRLFLTIIQIRDTYQNRNGTFNELRWGNSAGTIRWNQVFGSKLFANTTLYTGSYTVNLTLKPDLWKSELGNLSLKSDFNYYPHPKVNAKFGWELQAYFTNPGQLSINSDLSLLPNVSSNYSRKGVVYAQSSIDIFDKLKLNVGLRMIHWANLGPNTYYEFDDNYEIQDTVNISTGIYKNYFNADPRLSLQYSPGKTTQFKLSYGRYHQYLQQISNSISPFTALEVWLPSSPNIKPQASKQWALGFLKYFEKADLEFSSSGYYKKSENQIDYSGHGTTYLNPFLEGELRFGSSRAYGLEFLLRKSSGNSSAKLSGWISYNWSRVFRTTKDINDGIEYRALQDRPHDLSVVLNYKLAKRISFSANWNSQSGSTFTSPISYFTFNDQLVPVYGERNNDRLPAYHRLDLALKFVFNKKSDSGFQNDLTFSLYNALGHRNVYAVKFNKLFSEEVNPNVPSNVIDDSVLSPSQIDLIRFFPSLTYKFKI